MIAAQVFAQTCCYNYDNIICLARKTLYISDVIATQVRLKSTALPQLTVCPSHSLDSGASGTWRCERMGSLTTLMRELAGCGKRLPTSASNAICTAVPAHARRCARELPQHVPPWRVPSERHDPSFIIHDPARRLGPPGGNLKLVQIEIAPTQSELLDRMHDWKPSLLVREEAGGLTADSEPCLFLDRLFHVAGKELRAYSCHAARAHYSGDCMPHSQTP